MTPRSLSLVALASVALIAIITTAAHVAAAPPETVIKVVAKRFDYTPGAMVNSTAKANAAMA